MTKGPWTGGEGSHQDAALESGQDVWRMQRVEEEQTAGTSKPEAGRGAAGWRGGPNADPGSRDEQDKLESQLNGLKGIVRDF